MKRNKVRTEAEWPDSTSAMIGRRSAKCHHRSVCMAPPGLSKLPASLQEEWKT